MSAEKRPEPLKLFETSVFWSQHTTPDRRRGRRSMSQELSIIMTRAWVATLSVFSDSIVTPGSIADLTMKAAANRRTGLSAEFDM